MDLCKYTEIKDKKDRVPKQSPQTRHHDAQLPGNGDGILELL